MNIEFQIHGVLSSGQKTWKQEDKDYYAQFYSDHTEDILMIVEIVNRPHGVSAYYNYLRNNNIVSTRVGSYFGMTIRIDGEFCRDVKSIYVILDTLFNKMMIDSLLVPKGDNKYEYVIDSFATKNEYLQHVEKQFFDMLYSFCSSKDFFEITSANTSQGTKLCANESDITIPTVVEAVKQRAKVYLSPAYHSKLALKEIANIKEKSDAAIANANMRIKAVEDARSISVQKQEQEMENWKKEKQIIEGARDKALKECKELENRAKRYDLNASIRTKIEEIKPPLTQLLELMSEHSHEVPTENHTGRHLLSHRGKDISIWGRTWGKELSSENDHDKNKFFKRASWIIAFIFGFAIAWGIFYILSPVNVDQSEVPIEQAEIMNPSEDSLDKTSLPIKSPASQNKAIPSK